MYDYVIFCMKTFYARLIFFIFPGKLGRLKNERNILGQEIKSIIDKCMDKIEPQEYDIYDDFKYMNC